MEIETKQEEEIPVEEEKFELTIEDLAFEEELAQFREKLQAGSLLSIIKKRIKSLLHSQQLQAVSNEA